MKEKKGNGAWPYPVDRFQCHRCGNCCRGDGYVELTDHDIERIAAFLGLEPAGFLDAYCHFDAKTKRWNLIDQNDEHQSCIFLTAENTCRIHESKPEQCEGFPTKWRPANILEFCEGWRAAAGLPPSAHRTMSPDSD